MKINYNLVIPYLKPKELVMLIVGLIKLEIVERCLVSPNLKQVLLKNVDENYELGLLVSIWRNIIKANKTDDELNSLFIRLIINKPRKQLNLKDYGYLVFSYIKSIKKGEKRGEY